MNYEDKTDAEIDALVAERVMGDGYAARNGVATKTEGYRSTLWSPTTDANAMMEVVGQMSPTHAVRMKTYTTDGRLWAVDIFPRDCGHNYGGVAKLPLGRAVCIAALRAVKE